MKKRTVAALLFSALAAAPTVTLASELGYVLPPPREEWLDMADAVQTASDDYLSDGDPLQAPMVLCEIRGCNATGVQTLTAAEVARLRGLFDEVADAAAERRQIGQAIALLETAMGARNGTWRDHPANEREYEDEPGQLDCIAESINTHTYLDRLNRAGLIRHHQLGGFIHRYTVVLQHVAVDIIENGTDERFAVDSWVGANGDEPEIKPYGDWRWEWGV